MCCLYAYNCIALGVPIFIRGSPKSYEYGDPGSPIWGSLFSYDTGAYKRSGGTYSLADTFPRNISASVNVPPGIFPHAHNIRYDTGPQTHRLRLSTTSIDSRTKLNSNQLFSRPGPDYNGNEKSSSLG